MIEPVNAHIASTHGIVDFKNYFRFTPNDDYYHPVHGRVWTMYIFVDAESTHTHNTDICVNPVTLNPMTHSEFRTLYNVPQVIEIFLFKIGANMVSDTTYDCMAKPNKIINNLQSDFSDFGNDIFVSHPGAAPQTPLRFTIQMVAGNKVIGTSGLLYKIQECNNGNKYITLVGNDVQIGSTSNEFEYFTLIQRGIGSGLLEFASFLSQSFPNLYLTASHTEWTTANGARSVFIESDTFPTSTNGFSVDAFQEFKTVDALNGQSDCFSLVRSAQTPGASVQERVIFSGISGNLLLLTPTDWVRISGFQEEASFRLVL